MEKAFDFGLAGVKASGFKFAEFAADVVGFKMNALDVIVVAAAFDGGPLDDVVDGSAQGVAHISLLENFFLAGAGATVGDELVGAEFFVLSSIDDFEQPEFDSVNDGDSVVEVPQAPAKPGFLGEFIEESVFAVMGGPNGDGAPPADAALSSFPKETRALVFGEFVEADVAAVNGHGLGMGRECKNA